MIFNNNFNKNTPEGYTDRGLQTLSDIQDWLIQLGMRY
jgi:hypothetical protein